MHFASTNVDSSVLRSTHSIEPRRPRLNQGEAVITTRTSLLKLICFEKSGQHSVLTYTNSRALGVLLVCGCVQAFVCVRRYVRSYVHTTEREIVFS